MSFIKIQKEEIPLMHFSEREVLPDRGSIDRRSTSLHSAMVLGNTEKQKCRIVFHAEEGDACVETTIWAVTDKYICLKGGMTLLIASIVEVIL